MRVGSTAHHIKSILSNGLAEKRVQIVKKMRNKASADNQDLYLCLLAYRNTVIDNLTSPAHLLSNRRSVYRVASWFRTLIRLYRDHTADRLEINFCHEAPTPWLSSLPSLASLPSLIESVEEL